MSLTKIRRDAERRVTGSIEGLRQRVIGLVMNAASLGGWQGQALRTSVSQTIDGVIGSLFDDYTNEYAQAYSEGIKRANKEMPKGTPPSLLRADVDTFVAVTKAGFKKVEQNIRSDVSTILQRAASIERRAQDIDKSDAERTRVLQKIGTSREAGVFRSVSAMSRGIVTHELEAIEMRGYLDRVREGGNQRKELSRQGLGKESKKKDAGKHPITIKIWAHSDESLMPRTNHIAMHGLGVPEDMNFRLVAKNGSVHITEAPKDPDLPVGETANCKCTAVTVVIFVTEIEEKEIRTKALEGGYRDKRWAL